jgi:large subunit ribosomal protein L10
MPSLKVLEMKKHLLDEIIELMRKHEVVAASDLKKVKSIQIQEIRKKLRDELFIRVVKSNIVKMATKNLDSEKKNITEFSSHLTGPFALIFTNLNPFRLILLLNRNKVKVSAREGDVATEDIIVPAGNTALPPGPLISEFNEVGIQTRIEEGSIWIANDTVVAEKGDVVSAKLVSVLSRLGIKPMEAGLSLLAAYDNGSVLSTDDLKFDLSEIENNFTEALSKAMNLAVNSNYLTKDTAIPILTKACREAFWVAVQAEYPSPETLSRTILQAHLIATNISESLPKTDKNLTPEKK